MSELSFRVVNTGAQRKGEQLALGRCFKLSHFQLGSGGHNESDGLPLSVDVTKTAVVSPITDLIELPASSMTQVGPRTTRIELTLGNNQANGVISTIGLFGEIIFVNNEADASLIGTQFLYAVCNIQKFTKTSSESRIIKLFLNHAS
jgi:hypothetical protein